MSADIIWDFDGTILPCDSEQALLRSLWRSPRRKVGVAKALLGRLLAWADEHGYLQRSFKRLYLFCLRGLPVAELDALACELAARIPEAERKAVRAIHSLGRRMVLVSCGTGDLSQRVLAATGLEECFADIEANWLTFWGGRIEGMDLHIHTPQDKLRAVAELGVAVERATAVGDGFTDLPLLDAAAQAILVDRGGRKAAWAARRGYRIASSLVEVAQLLGSIEKGGEG